jgi:hypothetical protein
MNDYFVFVEEQGLNDVKPRFHTKNSDGSYSPINFGPTPDEGFPCVITDLMKAQNDERRSLEDAGLMVVERPKALPIEVLIVDDKIILSSETMLATETWKPSSWSSDVKRWVITPREERDPIDAWKKRTVYAIAKDVNPSSNDIVVTLDTFEEAKELLGRITAGIKVAMGYTEERSLTVSEAGEVVPTPVVTPSLTSVTVTKSPWKLWQKGFAVVAGVVFAIVVIAALAFVIPVARRAGEDVSNHLHQPYAEQAAWMQQLNSIPPRDLNGTAVPVQDVPPEVLQSTKTYHKP